MMTSGDHLQFLILFIVQPQIVVSLMLIIYDCNILAQATDV
jgi:hypothetical protein